jgi:hypothetical protein
MKHDGFQKDCLLYQPKFHTNKSSIRLFYPYWFSVFFTAMWLSIFYPKIKFSSKEMASPKLHRVFHDRAFHSKNQKEPCYLCVTLFLRRQLLLLPFINHRSIFPALAIITSFFQSAKRYRLVKREPMKHYHHLKPRLFNLACIEAFKMHLDPWDLISLSSFCYLSR